MRSSSFMYLFPAVAALVFGVGVSGPAAAQQAAPLPLTETPLYLAQALPPLNMLVMGKDHKNYYEAYNDASDLNGDGAIDVGFKPDTIDYFGYFNSRVCYTWSAGPNRFNPSVVAGGANGKQCSASGQWSGDFLNYLTTGRFDALRKVLYGGWRNVDSTSETVLQGAFFPQDGHSWGKEYRSIARDGFDIAKYAPLSEPTGSSYHLFAVTTLSDNSPPLLRVLKDSPFRIWNWVSIEGPVAGNDCFTSGNSRVACVQAAGAGAFPGHPRSRLAFDSMEAEYGIAGNQFGGSFTRDRIDCNGNNCNLGGSVAADQNNYMSIITGQIRIKVAGNYRFRINGDDNIDLQIFRPNGTLLGEAGCYPNGRGFNGNCGDPGSTDTLTANAMAVGVYSFKFRHEEGGGGDGYRLEWERRSAVDGGGNTNSPGFAYRVMRVDGSDGSNDANASGGYVANPSYRFYTLTPARAASTRDDYAVRVLVCPSTPALREANCKQYGTGASATFKPTGILHDFGETNRMYFGLVTGSQRNNIEGGVLRRNISSIADEINPDTGQIRLTVNGIIRTLDRFRMIGGGYQGDGNWAWGNGTGNCPTPDPSRELRNGECRMWGNPVGEMMFEALRYYSGAAAPHPGYVSGGANQGVIEETTLGLTTATWKNPYAATADGGLGFRSCAKPVMTVISDINPSYDSELPGNPWNTPTFTLPTTISGFNTVTEGSKIWDQEFGAGSRSVFIGQSGATTDGAPTLKSASSFGTIRGLSPEEPTKEGSYNSSAVAFYGWKKSGRINDLSTEKVRTYAVALASPLPIIQFPVNGRQLTFVPFAKTAGGTFGSGTRKPTNTIVDFYVETFVNLPGQVQDAAINGGRPFAVFRINYEDVEQGNDHDMDAIVRYAFVANADGTVTVTLNSEYAAGSAIQHMGYIATGTTTDGVYLEVRDFDTTLANSPGYIFNTPPNRAAGYCNTSPLPADCAGLPLTATRVFTPGGTAGAVTVLRDPLWYAAKYGGFNDSNANALPDLQSEWDANADGKPENYFLVTNALTLKAELTKAFSQIERDARPSGGVAASGARLDANLLAYVPDYNAEDWSGDVKAYRILGPGPLGPLQWSAAANLPTPALRKLYAMVPSGGTLVPRDFTVAGLGGVVPPTSAYSALGLNPLSLIAQYGATNTIFDVVSYLRGEKAKEVAQGGVFRDRTRVIGDILGSQPEVLSSGSFGFERLPAAQGGGQTGAGSYGAFVATTKKDRSPALFVGANDGFLHGFDGSTGASGGQELFAVAPNSTLSKMGRLIDPSYAHTFFVDAPPAQGDARLGVVWKTVLVSAAGAGGKSVMILDVTDPVTSFGTANILHEVSSSAIGHSFGRAKVVLAEDNRWYAVMGNGVNSASNQSGIVLIDLQTGAVKTILTGLGTAADTNGMGAISAIDTDGDQKIDTVYGGDYQGRLWKFDLSSSAPGGWSVALGGQPLYAAADAGGVRQQITGGVDVARHFDSGYMVYFGTGRYVLQGDGVVGINPKVETFYGVWDNNQTRITSGRAALQQQSIAEQVTIAGFGVTRNITRNPVDFTTKRGWFLDFRVADGTSLPAGERFFGQPRVILGRILFVSFTPVGDECAPGGTNWLYSLNLFSGAGQLAGGLEGGGAGSGAGNSGTGGLQLNTNGDSPPTTTPAVVALPPPPRDEIIGDGGGGDDPPPGGTPTTPPTSVRDRECQSNLGIVTDSATIPFESVSCGRQSWRQLD